MAVPAAAGAASGLPLSPVDGRDSGDRRRLRAWHDERRRLRTQVTHLENQIKSAGAFGEIVGDSRELQIALDQVSLAAPGDTTVLLLGETGCGKELLARLIHERSGRKRGPFVAVNCAALPESLVESELFGYEKGAFTGAAGRTPGKFEIASGGTLFLDEVGDLPAGAQAKLLRVLQDGQLYRVGGTQPLTVSVRIIAATNHDLDADIETRRFRRDLYYRLSVFPIAVPPLRHRRSDIAPLALYFVQHFAAKFGRRIDGMTGEAIERLRAYEWPGNVRELQNVIERAVILTRDGVIASEAVHIRGEARWASLSGVMTFADAERRAIDAALEASAWRISGAGGAAELLDLKPTTLHAKMKKLGIRRPPLTK